MSILLWKTEIGQLEKENKKQLKAIIKMTKTDRLAFLEVLKGEDKKRTVTRKRKKGRKKQEIALVK